LDAGPIVALLNRADQYHETCAKFFTTNSCEFITCEPAITEACFILRSKPKAVEDVLRNIKGGQFEIAYSLSARAKELARLVSKYADRPMSLADACLVDLAEINQTGQIVTLDADFEVYRWGRNRPFELLLKV
jgi:predicted nucleic acid-binding protein